MLRFLNPPLLVLTAQGSLHQVTLPLGTKAGYAWERDITAQHAVWLKVRFSIANQGDKNV